MGTDTEDLQDAVRRVPLKQIEEWRDLLENNPAAFKVSDGASLRALVDARKRADQANADMHTAVTAARSAGYSWAAIGAMLHMSKQAAQQRFG